MKPSALNLKSFYSVDWLQLTAVNKDAHTIVIRLKSITAACSCPQYQLASMRTYFNFTRCDMK